jgi:hypothetical protein
MIAMALGCREVEGWRSTRSERTPKRVSMSEQASPTGPPPTIRTGISKGLSAMERASCLSRFEVTLAAARHGVQR